MISIIAAIAENGVIGNAGKIPWKLSDDFKHFKQTTMGHPMIMGRKTLESLPGILRDRHHIVITRQNEYRIDHPQVTVTHSLKEALDIAGNLPGGEEIFITGGAEIYREAMDVADRAYITFVHAKIQGDTVFPILPMEQWREIRQEKHPRDERNQYPFTVVVLDKIRK